MPTTGYVDKIKSVDGGTIKVHRRGSMTTGPLADGGKPIGVDHTTQGSTIPAAFTRGAAHISPGPPALGARPIITQWIPFGQYATALENHPGGTETNRLIRMQMEIVGFSSLEPWLPASKEMRVILASLYEWAWHELGIPQRSVYPTHLTPGTWAIETNPHRLARKFPDEKGWYGHVDIPENDHWDPGSMQRNVLLAIEPEPRMITRYGLLSVWREDGHRESVELTSPRLKLREVGAKIASSAELRGRIKAQQAKGHRIVIARRAVKA